LPSAIARIEKISLGGVDQYILIRGRNSHNPLLLRLHGGPGQAEMAAQVLNRELEDDFVVVEWDQRGAGKSAAAINPKSAMTLDRIVQDTVELSRYLLGRFGQKKLLLMGHSWGSVVGLKAVQQAPALYFGLITTGQIVQFRKAQSITYTYLLTKAKATGRTEAFDDLKRLGPPPYLDSVADRNTFGKWLQQLGADWHTSKPLDRIGLMLSAPEYDLAEKFGYVSAAEASFNALFLDLSKVDFLNNPAGYTVPIAFFLGRYDYLAPSDLSTAYMKEIEAPNKKIVWFEDSAHFPQYEEPRRFAEEVEKFWREIGRNRAQN
jgi:pimeloyl-ACP methyl ester carboxylesterase